MPYKDREKRLDSSRKRYAGLSPEQRKERWQKAKGRVKERKQELRSQVTGIKVKRGCANCNERHPACLEFHHRDPTQKTVGINKMIAARLSMTSILAEIAKCDVFCSNCHKKIHWRALRRIAG